MSRILRLADAEAVGREAAREFVELAREAVLRRGCFCVALSGGATPRRMYELLAAEPLRSGVDWSRVEFFWSDERWVPAEHRDSNYGCARTHLLDRIGAAPEHVHRVKTESGTPEEAAREYEREIARVFGVTEGARPPAFDLVLLGLGADGHTASLFPMTWPLTERRRWVVAHFVQRLGAARITLTPPILNRAREIRMLVTGADKADALRAVIEGARETDRLPAQLVAPENGRLIWLVDEAAASKLRDREADRG
jgi:6-phosphogluconolactonase